MIVVEALKIGVDKFSKDKIFSPHLEAEILLSNILKKPREWILSHPEHELTNPQISKFHLQISKRLKGEPLAYLIGKKEFYGREFIVNKHVLIPRPETELMVDHVLNDVSTYVSTSKKFMFVDVGTGSGCMVISLQKEIENRVPISSQEIGTLFSFIATDISKPALTVARKNAKKHKVDKKIKFYCGNLIEPVIKNINKFEIRNSTFVICANLPYLTPKQHISSPTIQYEPKQALIGGNDGFKYYRELFIQIKKLNQISPSTRLRTGNFQFPITIFCEIDNSQKNKIINLAEKALSEFKIRIKKDLRGHDRLAILKNLS